VTNIAVQNLKAPLKRNAVAYRVTYVTQIIELCAMSLELPPLVRSDVFLFLFGGG